jgi:Bacterial type II/III secretion system short domain
MSKRYLLALLGATLLLSGGWSSAGNDAPVGKRLVYTVKYGSAKDLASALDKRLKDKTDIQVVADAPSNCLLVSAPPSAYDEVLKLIEQIDRPPQLVAVEVWIIPVTPAEGEKALDDKDFAGPSDEVLAKIQALQKKGQLGEMKRLRCVAPENQRVSVREGVARPHVRGVVKTATGVVSRMIAYRDLGSQENLTVRIEPEKTVAIDLSVEDARMVMPEGGAVLGTDENGKPIRAAEFIAVQAKAELTVPSGQAVPVKEVKTTGKSGGEAQTLVIVTARILDGNAPGGK